MDAGVSEGRQARRFRKGGRQGEVEAGRVFPGAVDEVLGPEDGDVVEHERRENLVYAEPRPRDGRNQRPEGPGRHPGRHHRGKEREGRGVRKREGNTRGRHRARIELPFGADIPEGHAESHSDAHRAECKRDGLDDRLRKAVSVAESALPHAPVNGQGIEPGELQKQGPEGECRGTASTGERMRKTAERAGRLSITNMGFLVP